MIYHVVGSTVYFVDADGRREVMPHLHGQENEFRVRSLTFHKPAFAVSWVFKQQGAKP